MVEKQERRLWTKDELIVAFNLYLQLPFGKLDSRTPEIIHLASLIGRNANAVSMRLNNFASVDPYHQQRGIKGLTGGKKQVQPIWDEFINNKEELLFESERILAEREHISIENKFADILEGTEHLKGEYKIRHSDFLIFPYRLSINHLHRELHLLQNNNCNIHKL